MSRLPSEKLILGVSLLVIGLLLVTGNLQVKAVVPSSSFESEPVQLTGFENKETPESEIPKRIIMHDVDVNLDIQRAELQNGYWEVFENTAGWGEGSGLPGQEGNQVIFAHARDGLFGPLKNVKKGMEILLLTEDKWYEYKVTTIREVYPGNTEFIEQTENEILTLYTCSGFQDSKRLIVRAERV